MCLYSFLLAAATVLWKIVWLRGVERREAEALSWALGYLLIDWARIPARLTASRRDGHAAISGSLQQDNMSSLHSRAAASSNPRVIGETERDTICFLRVEIFWDAVLVKSWALVHVSGSRSKISPSSSDLDVACQNHQHLNRRVMQRGERERKKKSPVLTAIITPAYYRY